VSPALAAWPVPVTRSLVTSLVGAGPVGTVTVGFFAIAAGGFAVVVTAASVAPLEGAVWTPGAVELLPHPVSAIAAVARVGMTRARFVIGV
jgi:hypothetical protein